MLASEEQLSEQLNKRNLRKSFTNERSVQMLSKHQYEQGQRTYSHLHVNDDTLSVMSSMSQNYNKSKLVASNRRRTAANKKSIKQLMRPDRKSQENFSKVRTSFDQERSQRKQSVIETQETDSKVRQRMNYIGEAIELDSLQQYKQLQVSLQEIAQLRFEYNMNILQLICHEEAITILEFLLTQLGNNEALKQELVCFRDSHLGSQALHLAAATGNSKIIKILLATFAADVNETTNSKQTVLHCAAQRYEGIAALFMFQRQFNIDVHRKDERGATALHFAAIGLLIKNVQALVKLGADPNSQDDDGNTPLHLCLDTLYDQPESFELVKNIVKELIFSGSQREITNHEGRTPIQILYELEGQLEIAEYNKMLYILTPPRGNKYLRMTRPIEKVDKNSRCQLSALAFNLLILTVFCFVGIDDYVRSRKQQEDRAQLIIFGIAASFFFSTIIFYTLTMIDPGYVQKQPNFQQLLDKLIEEDYHLDYVCVPCETLRPENADHCNFCNRCVQKFDHHCVFINNCLGYRNHKWFLLFLVSFSIYMVFMLTHSLYQLVWAMLGNNNFQSKSSVMIAINWGLQIFLVIVVLIHSPVVFLQLKSQLGKLCKQQEHLADETITNTNEEELSQPRGSLGRSKESLTVEVPNAPSVSRLSSFGQNVAQIFTFAPQSQEYLYQQLFGTEIEVKRSSVSNSQFKHLEPITEEDNELFQTQMKQSQQFGNLRFSKNTDQSLINGNINGTENSLVSQVTESDERLATQDVRMSRLIDP